jgi:hypothetical protein
VLAAFAPAMCLAMRRAASLNQLGAALQLTLPPAHGPPPGSPSTWVPPKPQLTAAPSQPSPTPLSVLDAPLVHTGYTTVAVREQVRRWVQHVSVNVVNSAWART